LHDIPPAQKGLDGPRDHRSPGQMLQELVTVGAEAGRHTGGGEDDGKFGHVEGSG
jgi:hypothetical protein